MTTPSDSIAFTFAPPQGNSCEWQVFLRGSLMGTVGQGGNVLDLQWLASSPKGDLLEVCGTAQEAIEVLAARAQDV